MKDLLGGIPVKKETPKRIIVPPKPPQAKKKKSESEIVDIEVFDGLDPSEVKKKLDSFVQSISTHLISCIEEQTKRANLAERKALDKEKFFLDKEKLLAAKNKELQLENAKLQKELLDRDARFDDEVDEIMSGAKKSAAVAILQARLEMVEDLEKDSRETWDVDAWKSSLEALTGSGEGSGLKGKEGGEKKGNGANGGKQGEDDGTGRDPDADRDVDGDLKKDAGGDEQGKMDAP